MVLISASLVFLSAAVSVYGQLDSPDASQLAAQSSYLADYASGIEAKASDFAAATAVQAALSTVSGIETKNVAADFSSFVAEAATATGTVVDPDFQYIYDLPATGGVGGILSTIASEVDATVSPKYPLAFSTLGADSQGSGAAQPSGAAFSTGIATSRRPGVAGSTGLAGAGSTRTAAASSSGAESTGAANSRATAEASNANAPSSTAAQTPAANPQSTSATTGGVASQPTGAMMMVGAAAAGVLGVAALL